MNIEELLSRVSEHLSVRRAVGDPYEVDGALLIPVAVVAGGGGGGGDASFDPATDERPGANVDAENDDEHSSPSSGRGGVGGGFGGAVIPLGVFEVRDGRTRFVPAYNATVLAVVAMGCVTALVRLLRPRRRAR